MSAGHGILEWSARAYRGILRVRWRGRAAAVSESGEEARAVTAYASDALELSRDRIANLIEHGAKERRGISARRLVRAYKRGQLREPGEVADLLALACLLSDDDPIVADPRRSRARR
jgi:hypothetical protein